MRVPKMQLQKLRNNLNYHGDAYEFGTPKLNEYGEPVRDDDGNFVYETVHTLNGIFHESGSGFIQVIVESAEVQSKPQPAILARYEDAKDIKIGETVLVPAAGNRRYEVVSVNDIGNLGLFADISLEVILDGVPV